MKPLIKFFTRLCEAYLPDAFVFCLVLTLIVFGGAWIVTPHSPLALLDFWGRDFWSLNAFAMQMVFVLISGHMLATTKPVGRLLSFITRLASNEFQGLILLSLFSILACWINWGFGLIVSGILAVELARKLQRVNFGLFVATAYSGFIVWHGGLSGSIPLKIASQDEMLNQVYPGLSIPLTDTILSPRNLILLLLLLIALPLTALWMRTEEKVEIEGPNRDFPEEGISSTFRDKLESHPALNFIFFGFFSIVLVQGFLRGESLDINRVNFIFLFLALLLHKSPKNFLNALQKSIGNASGIVIQFPFYAGIMGLMQHSGLADSISYLFIEISTSTTLPLWTFFSGGIVNFFVPSGGGQWVVQGPIMLKAAKELALDPARISMALAWGDAWTNMIQPFWVLPLLGLARLQLKDVMGYCIVYLMVSGFIISTVLIWP
jgi:short-chain fatty acids transporter